MADSEVRLEFVGKLGEEFVERARRGDHPTVQEYANSYPDYREEIEELFPALAIMEELAPVDSEDQTGGLGVASAPQKSLEFGQLGGYRIVREIGRGGMGVVYEAEQVSLGRHVALKVLSRELLASPMQRSRFQREAKAAAKLHHTNIVPVFGVGQDADQIFYVMQFIQGQGLDLVVDELRKLQSCPGAEAPTRSIRPSQIDRDNSSAAVVASSLVTGTYWSGSLLEGSLAGKLNLNGTTSAQGNRVAASTPIETRTGQLSARFSVSSSSIVMPGVIQACSDQTGKPFTYWQSAAQIGIQVAGALQYAHTQGILHRDIKPSNLLLDLRGTVWVTDFGLAKIDDEKGLTETGDILGTLRYMAPETFKGWTDVRSEVYSLGLTLYELLALRPAFAEIKRNGLIDQVANARIEPLGALNREIPADLQTIVHKAIDREPERRYQTAQELADDLQRFINDEPIKARRISSIERLGRWSRHNKSLAVAIGVVAMLISVLAVGSTIAAGYFQNVNSKLKLTVDSLTQARNELNLTVSELTSATSELTSTKDQAVTARSDAEKKAAENLQFAKAAEAARCESLTMLADMQTERGLFSASQGDAATAALWFANAARLTPHAPERQAANCLRARNWLADALIPEAQLKLPAGPIRRLDFQPGGSLMLTLNATSLRIWDLWLESPLAWSASLEGITDARWSPDGKQVIVASIGGDVRIMETWSGTIDRRFQFPGHVQSMEWAPDAHRVALSGTRVQVWNVADQPRLEQDWPHPNVVYNVSFSRSGKWLVTACDDGQARIFAVDGPTSSALLAVEHAPGQVVRHRPAPVFCDADHRLVTILRDHQPAFWDLSTGKRIPLALPASRAAYSDYQSLTVSSDGNLVGIGGYGACLVWRANGEFVLLPHDHHVWNASFSPDNQTLLTTCLDGRLRIWDAPFGARPPVWLPQMGTTAECSFSLDGLHAAMGNGEQAALIWRVPQQESIVGHIAEWQLPEQRPRPDFDGRFVTPSALHDAPTGGPVRPMSLTVALTTDGSPAGPTISLEAPLVDSALVADHKSVVAACITGKTGIVAVYDFITGKPVFPPLGLTSAPLAVATRPDLPQAAILCAGGHLIVLDIRDGTRIFELRHQAGQDDGVYPRVEYTPDGAGLIVLAHGNFIHVWDANSGERRFPAIGPQSLGGSCRSMAVSADNRFFATGVAGKNCVQIWNLSTGKPEGIELPHLQDWNGSIPLQFSRDGEQILTGHKDGQMRLWNWRNGTLICPPMQHQDEVLDVKFTQDGRCGLAAVRNSTVHLWDLATGKRVSPSVRYPVHLPTTTAAIAVAGHRVIASATGYPVIDLADAIDRSEGDTDLLMTRAELATNRRLHLGELTTLGWSEWRERWMKYCASRTTPETRAEAFARRLDEADDSATRKFIAERAARDQLQLLERLIELRPDVPQLHLVMACTLTRSGDIQAAAIYRAIAITLLEKSLQDSSTPSLLAAAKLEDQPLRWTSFQPTKLVAQSGCMLALKPDDSILTGPPSSKPDTYSMSGPSPVGRIAAIRLETLLNDGLPQKGPGWTAGNFHLTEFRVDLNRADGTSVPIKIRSAAADMIREVGRDTTIEDGPLAVFDGRNETHWDIWPRPGAAHWLAMRFSEPVDVAVDDILTVHLEFHDPVHQFAKLGCFRISFTSDENAIDAEQLLCAVRDKILVGPEAIAALRLVSSDALAAAEILNPQAELGIGQLLLAQACQKLGRSDEARSSAETLIEWLGKSPAPVRLQHMLFEVLTEIGGLDRSQFCKLVNRQRTR